MPKKTYMIPIAWECYGRLPVDADNLQEAVNIANASPLPDGDYVCDSEQIDAEILADEYPDEKFEI